MGFAHLPDLPLLTFCTVTPVCYTNGFSKFLVLHLVRRQGSHVMSGDPLPPPFQGGLGMPSTEICTAYILHHFPRLNVFPSGWEW